jgi:WD40 repeat protein
MVLPFGHTNSINSAKFSPNGKLIATISQDKTIRIWESKSGKLLKSLFGHKSSVKSICFSPDSKLIVSTSDFYLPELFVWDLQKGILIKNLEGHQIVNQAKFTPDGTKIVSIGGYDGNIGEDSNVKIWNAKTFKLIQNLEGHSRALNSINFSSNGDLFVTTSMDKTAIIWDLKSVKPIHILKSHNGQLISALFSPDGSKLVTTAQDNDAIIWDVASGKNIHILDGHNNWIDYIDFSFDGKIIVTSSWKDNFAKTWDVSTGNILNTFNGKVLIYNSNNKKSSSIKNDILIWDAISGNVFDIESGSLIEIKKMKTNNIEENCTVQFSPDGDKFILTGSEYKSMNKSSRIWDYVEVYSFKTGINQFNLQDKTINVFSNNLTLNGDKIITLGRDKNSLDKIQNCISCVNNLTEFELNSGRFISSLTVPSQILNFSSKQIEKGIGKIISSHSDTTIKIYDNISNKEKYNISWSNLNHSDPRIISTLFSPNGKLILTLHNDYTAALWDSENGKLIHILEGHTSNYIKGVFSPNNKHLLTISDDIAYLWDISSGKLIFQIDNIPSINKRLTKFSPKGNFILLTSEIIYQGDVFIFDAFTGEFIRHFMIGDELNILSADFSSDEQYVIASSYNDESSVWDFESGDLVKTLSGGSFSTFSPNNKNILTISDKVYLWDVKSFKLNKVFDLNSSVYNQANFNITGNVVCITSEFDPNAPPLIFNILSGEKYDVLNYSSLGFRFGDNLNFTPDGNFLIISSGDSKTIIWCLTTNKPLYEIIELANKNWIVKLSNSPYFMSSKEASKLLHYVTPSLKVIGFEQLDPIYNRPDIVLDSIGKYFGNSDGGMINEYRKSWEKRIDRLGLDKEKLGKGEIAVPNAEIVGADAIQYENKNGKLEINVSANDPKYILNRFNVYVNEVPIYGSAGISIAPLKKQIWDTTLSVPLSLGENKIQVSVMNELGLENFKYPTYVNYTPANNKIVSKTFYIGIGVNEFKDSYHNLKYCVKDVTDLAKEFKGKNTRIKLITNENVNRENILKLKKYLIDSTTVNDKVIISCSSHGLLDDSLNFYLATSDIDFKNPKENGIKYEEIENLLDSIPARQKLLLLDACNSGENDKTEVLKHELQQKKETMNNNQIIAARGFIIEIEEENKNNFKKMNELFVNVRNNTGSVIISAAGGKESALESIEVNGKQIENGAFTYSILECLKQNKDKVLKVNALKQYAETRVEEITNGKQNPTSRQETMEIDWSVK